MLPRYCWGCACERASAPNKRISVDTFTFHSVLLAVWMNSIFSAWIFRPHTHARTRAHRQMEIDKKKGKALSIAISHVFSLFSDFLQCYMRPSCISFCCSIGVRLVCWQQLYGCLICSRISAFLGQRCNQHKLLNLLLVCAPILL